MISCFGEMMNQSASRLGADCDFVLGAASGNGAHLVLAMQSVAVGAKCCAPTVDWLHIAHWKNPLILRTATQVWRRVRGTLQHLEVEGGVGVVETNV